MYQIKGYVIEDVLKDDGSISINSQHIPHPDVQLEFYKMLDSEDIPVKETVQHHPYRTFKADAKAVTPACKDTTASVTTKPKYNIDVLKLYEYIDNRSDKTATLKQIQSRFKDCGMTCEQILDYIDHQNTLYIAYSDLKYSRVKPLSKTKVYV